MKQNWTYKKLGEVAYYPNKRIAMKELSQHPYVGVENLIKDKGGVSFSETIPCIDSAIECQENDILIGNIRPYLRKIWLSDQKVGASGDIVVIRISQDHVNKLAPKFLYTVLSSDLFFNYDNANTKGAKMPRGDRKAIANYIIPVPPLSEQSRIVSELDLLQSIIDKQQAQLKELDTLAQAVFYDMFGDPVENEKGWEVKRLGDVCELKAGKSIKASELSNELSDGLYPCYGGNGIRGYIAKKSHSGTFPIIGRQGALCGNVNIASGDFYATEHAVVCTPFILLNEVFLFYTLVKMNLNQYAKGVAQPGLSVGNITPLPIILPPLPLQQSFASKIESIEKQKAAISQSIAETQKLFDYTMDKYFG